MNFIELAKELTNVSEEKALEIIKREMMISRRGFTFRVDVNNEVDYPSIDIVECNADGDSGFCATSVEIYTGKPMADVGVYNYSKIEEDDDYYSLTPYAYEHITKEDVLEKGTMVSCNVGRSFCDTMFIRGNDFEECEKEGNTDMNYVVSSTVDNSSNDEEFIHYTEIMEVLE